MHSTYSDGQDSIELMIRTAAMNKMEEIAITDHLYDERFMNGKSVDEYFREIDDAADHYGQVKVLKGVEGTILDSDGGISIPTKAIEKFELVLVDFAWKAKGIAVDAPLCKTDLMKNISKAFKNLCANRHVDIIAHPFNFGRLIKNFSFDWLKESFLEEIAGYFIEGNKSFEIMNDQWWWFPELHPDVVTNEYARILNVFNSCGVKFTIGSDSHSHQGIGNRVYSDVLLDAMSKA